MNNKFKRTAAAAMSVLTAATSLVVPAASQTMSAAAKYGTGKNVVCCFVVVFSEGYGDRCRGAYAYEVCKRKVDKHEWHCDIDCRKSPLT